MFDTSPVRPEASIGSCPGEGGAFSGQSGLDGGVVWGPETPCVLYAPTSRWLELCYRFALDTEHYVHEMRSSGNVSEKLRKY